jgi:hypothetical protein
VAAVLWDVTHHALVALYIMASSLMLGVLLWPLDYRAALGVAVLNGVISLRMIRCQENWRTKSRSRSTAPLIPLRPRCG